MGEKPAILDASKPEVWTGKSPSKMDALAPATRTSDCMRIEDFMAAVVGVIKILQVQSYVLPASYACLYVVVVDVG